MELVIGASGSGLDDVRWSKLPQTRIGINTAALKIPNCVMVAAVDYKIMAMDNLFSSRMLITTNKALNAASKNNVRIKVPYLTTKYHEYSSLVAIQFAAGLDVSMIHFVGFDFGKTRDSDLKKYYKRLPQWYINHYKKIKKMMFRLMVINDIKWRFEGGV